MNKVSDTGERKKEQRWFWNFRHPYVKLTSSLAFGNLRVKFALGMSIITPSTCVSTTGPYVHFLYKQAILWIEIYVWCFPAIQEKHSPSLVVATKADLTCVVQVCFIAPQQWRAGLPSTTLGQHQTHALQTWVFLFPFLYHLFHFLCVSFSPPMSHPNSFTPPVQLV